MDEHRTQGGLPEEPMRAHFPAATNGRVFLPVIHLPRGVEGGLKAVAVAAEAGAHGVFLINQGMAAEEILRDLLPAVRGVFPALWIGVNILGCAPGSVLATAQQHELGGVWADDAGVDHLDQAQFLRAREDVIEARSHGATALYFGGVAFKTQAPVPAHELPTVARRAATFVDVLTTSGPGTGRAADPNRVHALRAAVPSVPLGLASGVTPENVGDYLADVQAFLVATGIESDFGVLDPAKAQAVGAAIRSFGA